MSLHVDIQKKLHSGQLAVSFSAGCGHVGLLGESGSGKSMTLKCIAGIERPDEGVIQIDGKTVFDSTRGINLPPQARKTGYLFQNYALFPHLSLCRNIELVLPRSLTTIDRRRKAMEYVRLFGLEDIAHRLPAQVSGGQQQRLALARLLASQPALVLLDEPFSALDSTIKAKIEQELAARLQGFPGTVVLVTHNRDEAYRFCEEVIILKSGQVVEQDTRDRLFSKCRTVDGARITGCSNIAGGIRTGETTVAVPDWGILLETGREVPHGDFYVGIRSHHIRCRERGDEVNCIEFEVAGRSASPYSVSEQLLALTTPGYAGGSREKRSFLVREYAHSGDYLSEGPARVLLHIPPEKILLLENS